MNGLFLRLYTLVIVATLAVVAGSFIFVGTRVLPERNQKLADFLAPTLVEATTRIDAGETGVLDDLARTTGPLVALVPPDLTALTEADRRALDRGEVVVIGNELERYAYAGLRSRPLVVELELMGLRNRVVQWAAPAIATGEQGHAAVATLSPIEEARLAYRPIPIRAGEFTPAEKVVFRTSQGLRQVVLEADGPDDVRWLAVTLLLFFSAIAVVLPLLPLHRQLHALGNTASDLANGELEARVPLYFGGGPVHAVAGQFNGMAQQIQDTIRDNEVLLRSVAHEMRTPVARMVLALDLLEGDDAEARSARIEAMRQTTTEMASLTEELLDFAKLGDHAAPIETTPLDLREIIEDATNRWEGCDVTLPETRAEVAGDSRLLMRALDNAIGNAVRYASPPKVSLEGRGASWFIRVDDDGDGIPEEEWERVFEPFVRLESSRSRQTGGTGLGLAILRRIARAHGGDARVGRSDAGGTRIEIELPLG